MLDLLNDPTTYQLLPSDLTTIYKNELEGLLSGAKAEGIITDKEYGYLNITYPIIPLIYYLPKIHKGQLKPPARPIVSGINSITSHLSAYIDFFLQNYVQKMQSYLRDSQSLISL